MFDRDPAALHAFTEHLGRLKHDLGKYICFRQRWLPDDADHATRIEALEADLSSTRSGPAGTLDALQVWESFRPTLCGELPVQGEVWDVTADTDGGRIFAGMAEIERALVALRTDRTTLGVAAATTACRDVSDGIRSLHARARTASRSRS